MVWNSNCPDGTKSVKQNVPTMLQNTAYIESTMGNSTSTTKDHFWNIGVDEDGHHRAVQMMDYADTYTGAPVSPSLSTGMDLAIFARLLGPAILPFARNSVDIMQLLGIRAFAVWNNVAGFVAQTLVTSFNVTSVSRQAFGRYEVVYTGAVNGDYQFFCGGMGSSSNASFNGIFGSVASGLSVAARKPSGNTVFVYYDQNGSVADTLQGWLFVFGGYN